MTFVSYAQNYEDVLLWRAFRDIDRGLYIDVGAQDPSHDSVTRAFYERGWRGINIEPVASWVARLEAQRPKDTNLQLALSGEPGKRQFFEVVDTGLSTFQQDLAQRYEAEGYEVRSYEVAVETLDAVMARHSGPAVDFLKIDVEGAEADVLAGVGLERVRPKIILVEATKPNSQQQTHRKWQRRLTDRGYRFVYFDGLNRYYVADEVWELRKAFDRPPNYFDDFVRYPEWHAQNMLDKTNAALQSECERRDRMEAERDSLHRLKAHAEALLEAEQGRTEALERKQNTLRELKQRVEAQLQEEHSQREALASERDSLHQLKVHAEALLEAEQGRTGALEQEQTTLRELKQRVEAQLHEEHSQREALASERDSLHKLKVGLEEKLQAERERSEGLTRERDAAVVDRQEMQSRLEAERERNQELVADFESEHEDRTRVQQQLEVEWHAKQRHEATLAALYASVSWRMTKPARVAKKLVRKLMQLGQKLLMGIILAPFWLVRSLVLGTASRIYRNPALKSRISRNLSYFPRLKRRLKAIKATSAGHEGGPYSERTMRVSAVEVPGSGRRDSGEGGIQPPSWLSPEASAVFDEIARRTRQQS